MAAYVFYTDNEETTGSVFEIMGGWAAQTRWQRAGGHGFPHGKPYSIEDIPANWNKITNFDNGHATHPVTSGEAIQQVSIPN